MIRTSTELGIEGSVLCGQTLHPFDEDAVYAIYRMPNIACGLTVEKGSKNPYLRLTPGIQIPKELRDGFERFQFECDDDGMLDLTIDRSDGELVLRRDVRNLDIKTLEAALAPTLSWLNDVAHPAIMEYVAAYYRSRGEIAE